MRKSEITIQYFIDRGRRRTVTLSMQRLNTLLVAGLVVAMWCTATTGYIFYHLANGRSPFVSSVSTRKPVVAVGPNQPERSTLQTTEGSSDLQLSAKSLAALPTSAEPVKSDVTPDAMVAEPSQQVAEISAKQAPASEEVLAEPATPAEVPGYSLTNLLRFESALKKTNSSGPLNFRNVRITLKDDRLRVTADIEKKSGVVVEGFAFVSAEYAADNGARYLVTSHKKRDWESAVSAVKSATYFKARMKTNKRFDIVHSLNKTAKLVSLKLVAKDTLSGQTVIEEITPNVQDDGFGF